MLTFEEAFSAFATDIPWLICIAFFLSRGTHARSVWLALPSPLPPTGFAPHPQLDYLARGKFGHNPSTPPIAGFINTGLGNRIAYNLVALCGHSALSLTYVAATLHLPLLNTYFLLSGLAHPALRVVILLRIPRIPTCQYM